MIGGDGIDSVEASERIVLKHAVNTRFSRRRRRNEDR
jgi:hypothetical protein